jgi:hypothetical protein
MYVSLFVMTASTDHSGPVRDRVATPALGCIAAASMICVLSLVSASASAAPATQHSNHAASKCPVDHHEYASAESAKRAGNSVVVTAKLGKTTCGRDGVGYKFAKTATTITVPKAAVVKVLKNIMMTAQPARIPVSKLPHYINRGEVQTDGNIFQVTGPNAKIKKFQQVFIS